MADEGPAIELEHAIGYSANLSNAIYLHPNQRDCVYAAGGCVVVRDLSDPHNQVFLRGHDDFITCLSLSPSGRLIASGQRGDNADVIVWDYDSKTLRFRLSEHDYFIVAVAFSHDDRLLCTCGDTQDKRMFVWDMSNGCIVSSTSLQPDPTTCLLWGGFVRDVKRRPTANYLFATSGNKKIRLWNLDPRQGTMESEQVNTGANIREWSCMAFSYDGEYLYAGSTSGDFACIQIKNKILHAMIPVCTQGIGSLCFSPLNGIFVGGNNGHLSFFAGLGKDLHEAKQVNLGGMVNSLSLSADAVEVLAANSFGSVYRVRCSDLLTMKLSENHAAAVLAIAYAPTSSDRFCTASEDGTVRLWDASDYSVVLQCTARAAGVPLCVAYTPELLISGWSDGKLRAYNAETGEFLWLIDNAHRDGVTAVCISSNLRFIVSGGMEGEVRVWEIRSRELVSHLKEHTSRVSRIELFEDDQHVMSCSRDRSILCWDLRREKRITAHTQRMGGLNSLAISKDQTKIVTVGQERKITFWDLREINPVRVLDTSAGKTDECLAVTISHNGRLFAAGGTDQVVKVFEYETGRLVCEGRGHSGVITSLSFSPDDRQLISTGRDGNILVWNVYA